LGLGNTYDGLTPAAVKHLRGTKICQVSAGISHTAFLTDTGQLHCSGKGNFTFYLGFTSLAAYGRLGNGESDGSVSRPTLVTYFTAIQRRVISVGNSFNF
jgi:hypothetical protein